MLIIPPASLSPLKAQHEMILPSMLALIAPIAVGMVLDVAGVMGMLTGALSTGFALAVMLANSGGAWDNAKKWIESGKLGGKGSLPQGRRKPAIPSATLQRYIRTVAQHLD